MPCVAVAIYHGFRGYCTVVDGEVQRYRAVATRYIRCVVGVGTRSRVGCPIPCVIITSCCSLRSCGAIVYCEVQCHGTVAASGTSHGICRGGYGCRICCTMPHVTVASSNIFRGRKTFKYCQVESNDTIATHCILRCESGYSS